MTLLRNYGLTIVLAGLFFFSWLGQALAGWVTFSGEASQHGVQATLLGGNGFIWSWLADTFENWQSEFLQLFTMVVLTTFLIHRGSQQSKDSDEELKLMVERIERRIIALEKADRRG
jgi:hypothetical protein